MRITKLKQITAILLILVAAITTAKAEAIEFTNVEQHVEGYNKVTVSSSICVMYKQNPDSANVVRVYSPVSELENLSIEAKNGTLNVKRRGPLLEFDGVIAVTIYTPTLNEVKCKSGGVFTTQGEVKSTYLKLKVIGDSQIRAPKLKVSTLEVKRGVGQGDIIIGGIAESADYHIIGRGDIAAHNLEARDVKASIFGKGDIGVKATKELTVKVIGRGFVYQNGEVETINSTEHVRDYSE